MEKTRLLVVLLILWGIVCIWMDGPTAQETIQEAIKVGIELCECMGEENRVIMNILDSTMPLFMDTPPMYTEMQKLKASTREAEALISESQKLLQILKDEKMLDEKEQEIADEETIKKLGQFQKNIEKISATHQRVFDRLKVILYPLLELLEKQNWTIT